MPLSLVQASTAVSAYSDAARNSQSLFLQQADMSPGW